MEYQTDDLKQNGLFDADKIIQSIQKIKIATAIAIIKMTPPGMSAKEYASKLGEEILQHSDVWIFKSPEVGKLIQSLELAFSQDNQNSGNIISCSESDLGSKHHELVPSMSSFPDTSNSFVTFMRSILYFKKITSSHNPVLDEPELLNSVSSSLAKMFSFMRTPAGLKLPIEILEAAIKSVHSLFHLKEDILTEHLMQTCFAFVDASISDILSTLELNMFEQQQRRSSLIQMMAQYSSLTIVVVSKLMSEIIAFHRSLIDSSTIDIYALHPIVAVENVYFIFQTLENIINYMFLPENGGVKSLKLPEPVADQWKSMMTDITNGSATKLAMFCVNLFQVHSIITAAFNLS